LPSAPPARCTGPSINDVAAGRWRSGNKVTSTFCAGS
jgi:hypothetical protein